MRVHVVPDDQMESFRIICQAYADDIVVSTDKIEKFQKGQTVRIIEGKFKGWLVLLLVIKGNREWEL